MSRIDTATFSPATPSAPPRPAGGGSYLIQRGDTLGEIAARHGTRVEALMAANPQIRDPNLILAGDTLQLPQGDAPWGPRTIVQAGDTLSTLARSAGTDVATLARLNGIANPDLIHLGQTLRLPGGSTSPAPGVVPGTAPAATAPAAIAPTGTPAAGGSAPQRGITEAQYAAVARDLGVDVAALKAVASVESSGDGFLDSGKPKILFEAHVFHRETGGRFDASNPNLSSERWNRALYGQGGEHQWDRFDQAAGLDAKAAMKSASWGRFQIMGFNYQRAGFSNVQDFVDAMKRGEGEQLRAFANFVESDPTMLRALREHDWAGFARRYNGAGYAQNQYDTKIAEAYRRFAN